MKVKEVIEILSQYNPEADVIVIDRGYVQHQIEHYGYGYSDGCTKENCEDVSFIYKGFSNNEKKNN